MEVKGPTWAHLVSRGKRGSQITFHASKLEACLSHVKLGLIFLFPFPRLAHPSFHS